MIIFIDPKSGPTIGDLVELFEEEGWPGVALLIFIAVILALLPFGIIYLR